LMLETGDCGAIFFGKHKQPGIAKYLS